MTVPHILERAGFKPSPLAFGTLTISPMQRNLPPERGAELIRYACARGINLFDTAQLYHTYEPLRIALRRGARFLVSTKSYAYDAAGAREAFDEARRALDMDTLGLMLMHEQESEHTLRGHREAFDFYLDMQARGLLYSAGVSTHRVAAAKAAARYAGLTSLHPLINVRGLGIADGTRAQMEDALREAHEAGIFIMAMKPLGGGHLIAHAEEAARYITGLPYVDCVAVGMQSEDEIDANCALFMGAPETPGARERARGAERRVIVHDWCRACGACAKRCGQGAIAIADGRARVDEHKCVRCGYCVTVCPDFCIKVV